jgi:hypothetical protein
MIRLISTLVTISLHYNQYSPIVDLHTFQFTIAHAVGFFVFISRLLAADLKMKLVLQITIKSPCHFLFNHHGTSELN